MRYAIIKQIYFYLKIYNLQMQRDQRKKGKGKKHYSNQQKKAQAQKHKQVQSTDVVLLQTESDIKPKKINSDEKNFDNQTLDAKMAEQIYNFEEVKAGDNLRESMASIGTMQSTRIQQRISNRPIQCKDQGQPSAIASKGSPSQDELQITGKDEAMSNQTNNTASFNGSYRNEHNFGCGTVGALAQLNNVGNSSFIRLNKSDAAEDHKSIDGGLGDINHGEQIYIDDKISSHTLQTNQIFQSKFFYNSQIDVSEEPDEVGCTVVEQNQDDEVDSTIANPLVSTPNIEKGRQNSEMDQSDLLKMQNRLIDNNFENICEIKSVDNGPNYFKHNTNKHRKNKRQKRQLNCNSIKSIASIRRTLNPSQNNSEQPGCCSQRQFPVHIDSKAPGSCSGLNSGANGGNLNKLPIQCHNSFEEEEVIEENIEVEESSNEKGSQSKKESIDDGIPQDNQRDIFRIDRLKMVSYQPNSNNFDSKNDFDIFNQGSCLPEFQQSNCIMFQNKSQLQANHPFNCSANNSNSSLEEKYHMPFFPQSYVSKNNNTFGFNQNSFLNLGLLGESEKQNITERDCINDLEQNFCNLAHPLNACHPMTRNENDKEQKINQSGPQKKDQTELTYESDFLRNLNTESYQKRQDKEQPIAKTKKLKKLDDIPMEIYEEDYENKRIRDIENQDLKMRAAPTNSNEQSEIFVLSQQMENRIKSQYGDEDLNHKSNNLPKSIIQTGTNLPSNEIPIIDFYPSEDEYNIEPDDFIDPFDNLPIESKDPFQINQRNQRSSKIDKNAKQCKIQQSFGFQANGEPIQNTFNMADRKDNEDIVNVSIEHELEEDRAVVQGSRPKNRAKKSTQEPDQRQIEQISTRQPLQPEENKQPQFNGKHNFKYPNQVKFLTSDSMGGNCNSIFSKPLDTNNQSLQKETNVKAVFPIERTPISLNSTNSIEEEIKEEIKIDFNDSDEDLNMYSRHSSVLMIQSAKGCDNNSSPSIRSPKYNSKKQKEQSNFQFYDDAEELKTNALNQSKHSGSKVSRRSKYSIKSSNSSHHRHGVKFSYFAASSLSDDRWLCPICLDIYEDAVETPCCHNLFCEACIKQTTTCPLCNLRIVGQLRPNIPIRRLVHELSINCPNEQCNQISKIGDIDKHLQQCKYTPVACPNSDQCAKILRKNLESHKQSECPFRIIDCLLECGLMLPLNDMDDHIRDDCPNFEIQCKNNCGASIPRGKMQQHIIQVCPLEIVECPNKGESLFEEGCLTKLKRREMESHKVTCNFRRIQCQNQGCSQVIIYKDLQSHDDRCLYKVIECDNKCGNKIQRQNLERHKESCEFQLIKCPYYNLGCKIEILRKDYKNHLQEEYFNHSIIFIEGQKRKNAEIDNLKHEIAHLRKDYDVEIKTMFLELTRVKNELQIIKSNQIDENQNLQIQTDDSLNFAAANQLNRHLTQKQNFFQDVDCKTKNQDKQIEEEKIGQQIVLQKNNSRLKPMVPVSGLGNNRLNHYQNEMNNQSILRNPQVQRPLQDPGNISSSVNICSFPHPILQSQPNSNSIFRVFDNNSLSNHTNNGSVVVSGSASAVLMRSKNDLQPSRQSNSANLNFLAPSNSFSQTQIHEECKVQGNINQVGGSNPSSSLFSPSKPPPAVSEIKNTQDNQLILKTNSAYRPVAENLSINSVSQESATIGTSLWPNSQVNGHQKINRSPSQITRPQLSGMRQDPELSNLIKINPFIRNCNPDSSRLQVNQYRTREPEEEKKQASRDQIITDRFRITIENKANEDLSFTRHQVKPQQSREQAKSNPLQQVTSESDLKMIEQSFKNSNPILIQNQSLNYNQASQQNSWWNQPPQNFQHFQEEQQLGVQRNSSLGIGQENKDQKNISYSVESNSFYEWQDNEYEQSEKAEESKRIQEQNRSRNEKRELFNYSGSKQGSLNQARIHQIQNQSISSSYTNYSQISQDLISSNKSESKNGSLLKIGLLPSLIQSPQRKDEKLSSNMPTSSVDKNIFGMNSRTLSKESQIKSKIKIDKDCKGRDNKRQIFQPVAKEPNRALNSLGQHPSQLSSSKAKSSFVQHPLTNTSPIKRLGEQKPSEAQARAGDGRRTKLYDYDGDSENVLYDEEYWLVEQAFQSKPQTKDSKDPILDWEETKKEDVKTKKAVEISGGPDECGEKVLFEQDFGLSAHNAGGDFQSASIRKNLYKCETEREHQRSKTKTTSHNFNMNPQRTTRVLYSNHQFGNCSLSSSGAFNKRSPDELSNRKTMQAQDNRVIEEESKKDPHADNNSKEERKASDQSDGFDEYDSIVWKIN